MRILLVEDELHAAKRIKRLVNELAPDAKLTGPIDTVDELRQIPLEEFDLILSDIQLADGLSIEVYRKNRTETPIIFTTAYDQFAIEAFELNSIHYLLKPIASEKLKEAFEKIEKSKIKNENIETLLNHLKAKVFQKGFTFQVGHKIIPVRTTDILCFKSIESVSYAYLSSERRYPTDESIETLSNKLNPEHFYQLNRGAICSRPAIKEIKTGLHGKLTIYLHTGQEESVSREKAKEFKAWLEA